MHRLQDARGDPRASDRLIAPPARAGGSHGEAGRAGAPAGTPPDRVAGRFAPTPSGPLHVGSLIAAVASRCDALSRGGEWMLRIDDIDPPRERPGARASILATLERHGFRPDGPVRYQSARLALYGDALRRLAADGHLYRCRCTRRALSGLARYPGTCRDRRLAPDEVPGLVARPLDTPGDALRLRVDATIRVHDLVQGTLDVEPDDPVLRRRDGLVAYPLASAVDDADVARVVRGADLLDVSAAQIAVLERLGPPSSAAPRVPSSAAPSAPPPATPSSPRPDPRPDPRPNGAHAPLPEWAHVPVAVDGDGVKLGKSTGAPAVDESDPLSTLLAVWTFLGQEDFAATDLDAFWREAPGRWSLGRVPRARERLAPAGLA